jgi:hypothetical protein
MSHSDMKQKVLSILIQLEKVKKRFSLLMIIKMTPDKREIRGNTNFIFFAGVTKTHTLIGFNERLSSFDLILTISFYSIYLIILI